MFSCPLINTEQRHRTIIQQDNREGEVAREGGGGGMEGRKEGTEEMKENIRMAMFTSD